MVGRRSLLLFCAGCLLISAGVLRRELKYNPIVPWINNIFSRQPQAHMNMDNRLGDHDFFCLDKGCDDQGGFQGRQTGYLYANRLDAVKGLPMRTHQ